MPAIVVTPANVLPGSNAVITTGTAGATITAGQAVYLDAATNTFKLADSSTTAAESQVVGIALNGASAGQPLNVQRAGDITIGGTVVVGAAYLVSTTAGGIEAANATTGNFAGLIGLGLTTAIIRLAIAVNNGTNAAA